MNGRERVERGEEVERREGGVEGKDEGEKERRERKEEGGDKGRERRGGRGFVPGFSQPQSPG